MNNKKILFGMLLLFLIFISTNISAYEIEDFEVTVVVKESNSAEITEKWFVSFLTAQDKENFKRNLLEANINVDMLEKISSKLKPKVYINDYSGLKIGFDEINDFVRLEYVIKDVVLIKYLDYENEIIWRFNDNIFRNFVSNNLYNVPSTSKLKIVLEEPLVVGETSPKANHEKQEAYWTGISSNELRLIAIEKKPPKPTFVISSIFEGFYLTKHFFYFVVVLLGLLVVLLVFKKKVSKNIKKFVIKHSKINPSKNRKDIIDFEYFNK
jgi:hypothetical protein